ncbi:MAG TPA: hypothetical protein DCR92_02180 [Faecalibacterium sp.]|nr:hypothetical protein [Faecalibacterium sp.]
MSVAFSSDASSGCGSQHPLRYRLRLAGRGPNNSSLFPPLAAVAVVAGHSIARPIAFGNRVPPQRTVFGETPGPPPRVSCSFPVQPAENMFVKLVIMNIFRNFPAGLDN